MGLAPRAAFEGFPDDVPLRGFDPERHLIEERFSLPRLMAQTKRKRKHRGTAAGTIEARGRTGRPPKPSARSRRPPRQRRQERMDRPPTWRGAVNRAAIAAVVFFVIAMLVLEPAAGRGDRAGAVRLPALRAVGLLHGQVHVRAAAEQKQKGSRGSLRSMDVRMFTVGPVMENCFLFRRDGSDKALIVDPGEEAPKLLNAIEELGRRARGDPADAHALRPRRRRRARREGDRRRGLGARDREAGARRHHELRARGPASGRTSRTTPSTRSRAASGSSWPASRSTSSSRRATAPAT